MAATAGMRAPSSLAGTSVRRGPLLSEVQKLTAARNVALGGVLLRPCGISTRRVRRSGVSSPRASLPFFASIKGAGAAHGHAAGKAAGHAATHARHGVPVPIDDGPIDQLWCMLVRKISHGEYDPLSHLPEPIHKMLHKDEAMVVFVLREATLLFLVFLLISNRHKVCHHLHQIWSRFFMRDKEITADEYGRSMFAALSEPLGLSLTLLTATRIVRVAGPFVKINVPLPMIHSFQGVVLVVASVWFFLDWKSRNFSHILATVEDNKAGVVAIDKLLSLFIYVVGFASFAEITGLALKSVVAIGGASSLAVGFASKAVVSNFVGGLMLYVTRPFSIGDKIKAGSHSGQVLDIGFYSTKLLGGDSVPVYVPNDSFTNLAVTNYTRAKVKALDATLLLRTQHVILSIDQITAEIDAMIKSHPAVDLKGGSCYCALKSVGHEFCEIIISCTVPMMGTEKFSKLQQSIVVKAAQIIIRSGGLFALATPMLEDTYPENGPLLSQHLAQANAAA